MAKASKTQAPGQYKTEVSKVYTGLHNDNNPLDQPQGCHRFALNAVNEAKDGQKLNLSNERAALLATLIPEGHYILGDRYLEDNTTALIITNPTTGHSEIGLVHKDEVYRTVVSTNVLNLRISHQCDTTYRLRRGKERVLYWVDGFNRPRSFNFEREFDYYNNLYKTYLKGGGDPNTYPGEKFEESAFDLIKSYKSVPSFTDVDVVEVGSIVPGSYNFSIQYVDNDLNPTEWITTSNTVNIYNDAVDGAYYKIRGSRNVNNGYQQFDPANKSIRLTITNLDTDFPYYRIAIIVDTNVLGQPTQVFASDVQSTSNSVFLYSGNNSALTQITLEDILIKNEVIFAPNHIEQIENRLILANTRGQLVNWCEFQKFASKIKTDLATKEVILNSTLSEPNVKNAKSTFIYRGYMPGEAYSLGICWLFADGTVSPTFHIPGPSPDDTSATLLPYIVENTLYEDIHNCSTNNYWAKDYLGDSLVGSQVRHHRFPFRSDINEPLFTRTGESAIIQKHKLTFKFSLVSGQTWPTDGSGDDLVIPYKIVYKIGSTGSNVTISKSAIKGQLDTDITIYDDVDALGNVSGTPGTMAISGVTEGVLLIEAGSITDYITSGVLTVSGTYVNYDAETVNNVDRSNIFGIQLSNIEKPSDDVIGFYIVRNERRDDDKLVVDNAVFGPMIENNQYKAFGLLMPKQYYTVTGCNGGTKNSGKELSYYKRGSWFFNPEFQFFSRKTGFNNVNVQGTMVPTAVNLPSWKDEYWDPACSDHRGVYIQDVQPGTSFNPDVNKGSDSDGFDMIIGYRNTTVNYQILSYNFPAQERTFYISASNYQPYNDDLLYNVSSDNKIGVMVTETDIDTEKFYNTGNKNNYLLYAALTRDNISAYANFMTRPYYKEHNDAFLFGGASIINGVSVFNGDAMISPISISSSVYYDTVVASRKKKSKVWQIVVGAVLVVAGVVAAVLTAGASLPLSAAAISYGVSLAVAGFKFEQFKNMIDEDYSKGLGECVTDGDVYACIDRNIATADDTIRWFGDLVSSMYIESSVMFGLRDGLTSGVVDFMDSPSDFQEDTYRSYLTEKLTTIDRDQGSGRLYKGYATAEFYSMNLDYLRFNKETVNIHLPLEYDCCADANETFTTRVWWSEQSFQEETVDNYRVFLPNNYTDIEGEHGQITDLFKQGNALYVHCREALFQLPQNVQERVTGEIVSFIGTGSFFSIPPRKVIDDNLGSGGTQHKWATVKTIYGVLFVNEIENKVYILAEKLREISNEGLRNWFKENLRSYLNQQFYTELGVGYANENNPANPAGIGYLAAYDTRHNRYILTKKDYIYLGDFSKIIVDFDPSIDYPIGSIIITDNGFEEITSISYSASVPIVTGDWVPDDVGNITPALPVPTSPTDPLELTYGDVYMQNGALIYKADSFEDIDFGGNDHVTDIIPVLLNACEEEEIEIRIPNIPSKRCPNFFDAGGTTVYAETKIVLGPRPGVVKFLLSTYNIPDGFSIYYGEPSDNVLLWSTCQLPGAGAPPQCLVSTAGLSGNPAYTPCSSDPLDGGSAYQVAIFFNYNPSNPDIQHVTLVTQAPSPGTAWSYNMGCPCQGGLPVDPDDASDWNYCLDCAETP